ncbi:MAG: M28 family peptidase [Planctomycetes bacterium]|nr:M28 family peptidase [Planctomycetota bacterium]
MTKKRSLPRPLALLAVLALAIGTCLAEEDKSAVARTLFTAEAYLAHVRYLASDELGGRLPGTPGSQAATEYIAEQFQKLGLKPGGVDDTYFQPFTIRRLKQVHEDQAAFKITGLENNWKIREDWIPMPFSKAGKIEGPLAFAGYGISAPKLDYDDYAGFDATDKILLILRHEPKDEDPEAAFGGETPSRHALFSRKARVAAEKGAKGLLIVNAPNRDPDKDQLYPWDDSDTRQSYSLPIAHISRQIANAILEQAGMTNLTTLQEQLDRERKPLSTDLEGITVDIESGVEYVEGRNVIGLLEGEGKSEEYIVVGAHHDHLGRVRPHNGQSSEPVIHNGADDNASGTAGVIELARVFAAGPRPQRSILFMTYDAEELGLLGSHHFLEHPTVEPENIVAMVALDMIGRLNQDRFAIYGVGSGKEFRELLDAPAEKLELTFKAPASGSGWFGGSDHHSFYLKDIPVLFVFTGIHKQYHTPEDDWELIDGEGATKVLQLMHPVISEIASMGERPTFVSAAEEEAARDAQKEDEPQVEAGEETDEERAADERPARPGRPRASLRIIPDHAYDGDGGFRVLSVIQDGPAAKAGMKDGDLIVRIADEPVSDIDSYMDALKQHEPGDQVEVVVKRGEEQVKLKVTLGESRRRPEPKDD